MMDFNTRSLLMPVRSRCQLQTSPSQSICPLVFIGLQSRSRATELVVNDRLTDYPQELRVSTSGNDWNLLITRHHHMLSTFYGTLVVSLACALTLIRECTRVEKPCFSVGTTS